MKWLVCGVLLTQSISALFAGDTLPIEREVTDVAAADRPTIVHFWAPWCPNCTAELANHGWAGFLAANPNVNVIFVTVWSRDQGDGRAMLAKNGVGAQKNFRLLLHPNPSTRAGEKTTSFLGLPLTWLPTTWIFRQGKLRYALNYGEVRFPMLQQLVRDTEESWDR